jgi:hypothetical protein
MQSSPPSFETLRYNVFSSLYRIIRAKQHTAMDAILWQELESYGIDGSSVQKFNDTVKGFTWNTLKSRSHAMDVMRMHFEVAYLAATWLSEIPDTTASSVTVRKKMEKSLNDLPSYIAQCNDLFRMEHEAGDDANRNSRVEVSVEWLNVQNPDAFAMSSNTRSFSLRHIVDVVDGKISALAPPDMYVAYFRRVNFSEMTVTSNITRAPLTSDFERNNSGSLETSRNLQHRAAAELASWNDSGDAIGRFRQDVGKYVAVKRNVSGSNSLSEDIPPKRPRIGPPSTTNVQPENSSPKHSSPKHSSPTQIPASNLSNFLNMLHAEREHLKSELSRLLSRLGTIDQLVNTNLDLDNENIQKQMDELIKVIRDREG